MVKIYRQTGEADKVKEATKPFRKPLWYKRTERLLKVYKNLPFELKT